MAGSMGLERVHRRLACDAAKGAVVDPRGRTISLFDGSPVGPLLSSGRRAGAVRR